MGTAGLEHVKSSVQSMCLMLNFNSEFLVPAPDVNPELVLHEIFQRQLFQLYCQLKDDKPGEPGDVILDTSSFHPLYKDERRKTPVWAVDHISSSHCPTNPQSLFLNQCDAPAPSRSSKRSLQAKANVDGDEGVEVSEELDEVDDDADSQRESKRRRMQNGQSSRPSTAAQSTNVPLRRPKIKDQMKKRGSATRPSLIHRSQGVMMRGRMGGVT
ncbi:hypothetical protein D9758_009715 [Tetrapyrgos nigripes]|uniref:Uncharacterized protein n=1 Tax=Tetrapyrgos nigripes TaxID=182062 RepID=A0A8H5CNY2_9AGAR|nr:hypothetical protein D9758_009715 [Tetrapyrgos nigripes]